MRSTSVRPSSDIWCAFLCPVLLFVGLVPPQLCLAQERCGLAKDFMVQALEHIKTGATNEAEDGLQLLKHANEQCLNLGDAWYYRSLFERKLNQTAKANYSLGKAKMFGSEAMDQELDPFVVATGAPAGPVTLGPVREKWALVIGISKFQDTHVPRLNYPGKDAQDFASLLKDPQVGRFKPENVHLVVDADATTRKIKMELNWLARSAKPDDLVVVFLASHGSPRSRDIAGVNYIITSDTVLGDPNKDPDSLFATALPMVDLSDIVRGRIQARRTTIFLDTCHSGAAAAKTGMGGTFGDGSASGEALDRIRQGVGRVIIASSTEKQKSWESQTFHNGYFTHYLVEALTRDKGLAPVDKVFAYVRDKVSEKVAAEVHAQQSPVLSRSEHGAEEIVIGVAVGTGLNAPLGRAGMSPPAR
jgi:uncharacterized caspase-like protein